MAPRTPASVCCCSSRLSYSREELMNIRATTPVDLFPSIIDKSHESRRILTKSHPEKLHRGKRAGVRLQLRIPGHQTPLPGVFLSCSGLNSLYSQMDKLQHLVCGYRYFSASPVLCFTGTGLCASTPDSALQLAGFQLFRADRRTDLSGNGKGGGICFYINHFWCIDVRVIGQHCSPDLEYSIINCKPVPSMREFASFILVGVYVPPGARVRDAQRALACQILRVERAYPDSLVIVLGHFNTCNLTLELPRYKQFITLPTREMDSPDHCYTTVGGAYRAVLQPPLAKFDLSMVHLIPTYNPKNNTTPWDL